MDFDRNKLYNHEEDKGLLLSTASAENLKINDNIHHDIQGSMCIEILIINILSYYFECTNNISYY